MECMNSFWVNLKV